MSLGVAVGYSELATAAAAWSALALGVWQVKRTERFSRASDAYKAYDDYMRLCIDRPEFGYFEFAQRQLGLPDASKIWECETKESESYLWFVANMLNCFERVILAEPYSKDWRSAIKAQINYHKPLIGVIWDAEWKDEYSPALGRLVEDVVGVRGNA